MTGEENANDHIDTLRAHLKTQEFGVSEHSSDHCKYCRCCGASTKVRKLNYCCWQSEISKASVFAFSYFQMLQWFCIFYLVTAGISWVLRFRSWDSHKITLSLLVIQLLLFQLYKWVRRRSLSELQSKEPHPEEYTIEFVSEDRNGYDIADQEEFKTELRTKFESEKIANVHCFYDTETDEKDEQFQEDYLNGKSKGKLLGGFISFNTKENLQETLEPLTCCERLTGKTVEIKDKEFKWFQAPVPSDVNYTKRSCFCCYIFGYVAILLVYGLLLRGIVAAFFTDWFSDAIWWLPSIISQTTST